MVLVFDWVYRLNYLKKRIWVVLIRLFCEVKFRKKGLFVRECGMLRISCYLRLKIGCGLIWFWDWRCLIGRYVLKVNGDIIIIGIISVEVNLI